MHLIAAALFLLGQHPPDWQIGMYFGAMVLLFLSFIFWLSMRHAGRCRALSHTERMKALESGQPPGPTESEQRQSKYTHSAFWIAFWIGAVVPIAATSAASSVMVQTGVQEFRIVLAIWICVAAISIAGVVCATILVITSGRWSPKGEKPRPAPASAEAGSH